MSPVARKILESEHFIYLDHGFLCSDTALYRHATGQIDLSDRLGRELSLSRAIVLGHLKEAEQIFNTQTHAT